MWDSEGTDQTAHLRSLIRACAVRLKNHWMLSMILNKMALARLRGCTGYCGPFDCFQMMRPIRNELGKKKKKKKTGHTVNTEYRK